MDTSVPAKGDGSDPSRLSPASTREVAFEEGHPTGFDPDPLVGGRSEDEAARQDDLMAVESSMDAS